MPPAQLLRFDSYPGHIVQENSKYARILGAPLGKGPQFRLAAGEQYRLLATSLSLYIAKNLGFVD